MRRRLALLLVLIALGGGLAAWQWRDTRRFAAAEAVCAAASERRFNDAVSLGAGLSANDAAGFAALDCRCIAHLATGELDRCLADLEPALAAGMTPSADVARVAAVAWFERGNAAAAAVVARRAAAEDPGDADLFELELVSRSAVEDAGLVLAELDRRARGPDAPEKERRVVALTYLRRGEIERCLDVLGEVPPTGAGADHWHELRSGCLARLHRFDEVRALWSAWQTRGGDAATARVRPVLDEAAATTTPSAELVERLGQVYSELERLPDRELQESLAERYARYLGATKRVEEATAVVQRARALGLKISLSESDLRVDAATPAGATGRLQVVVRGAPAGARLRVSPAPGLRFDAPYTETPLAGTPPSVTVVRALDSVPVRVVAVDDAGNAIASGAGWPSTSGNLLELAAGTPVVPAVAPGPTPMSADGRRRLFVVIPDGGDWRLAGYLLARGELPVLRGLLDRGWRAVLDSTPAYTAAAMRSLVWPAPVREVGVLSVVNELGDEIGGLASVGKNPFAGLALLLPPGNSTFDVLGAGELVAANMLFTHGDVRAGRHAEKVGPRGARGTVALGPPFRRLTPDEIARWPALSGHDGYVETIAGELRALQQIVEARDIDVLLLRLEPLDILSHTELGGVSAGRQDDGAGLLYDTYRLIDHELGRAAAALDADDTLVVMSDHGAKNGLEHDANALFVMVGPGVPHGDAPGRPALAGAPRVFAAVLGVDTDWPDSGVAPWLTSEARR
ncbi:MAG: hypothetical protein HYS27_12015 [Deltaproteobacteria bacterium]|nr:hypothetical protein [Deltaproteobacteria bacterium]